MVSQLLPLQPPVSPSKQTRPSRTPAPPLPQKLPGFIQGINSDLHLNANVGGPGIGGFPSYASSLRGGLESQFRPSSTLNSGPQRFPFPMGNPLWNMQGEGDPLPNHLMGLKGTTGYPGGKGKFPAASFDADMGKEQGHHIKDCPELKPTEANVDNEPPITNEGFQPVPRRNTSRGGKFSRQGKFHLSSLLENVFDPFSSDKKDMDDHFQDVPLGKAEDPHKSDRRFILDTIITLRETFEYAEDVDMQYVFFKIDFDKAYDRIEWDFILQSLHDIGFGKLFVKYIHVLFGNALAQIAINGELTDKIVLLRCIRQGCPVAPLLFSICSDSLGWLVKDAMTQGIDIPGTDNPLCLQQFADDTNAVMSNDDQSINQFWICLKVFCSASGSSINHTKTGYRLSSGTVPTVVTDAGCKRIEEGHIFRLLGIPMGFKVFFR
ncbi:hypothetical protein L7F22_060904 [Adiantum nelumboides]|nr:hypothetical protein [Adiantum nelumboides]